METLPASLGLYGAARLGAITQSDQPHPHPDRRVASENACQQGHPQLPHLHGGAQAQSPRKTAAGNPGPRVPLRDQRSHHRAGQHAGVHRAGHHHRAHPRHPLSSREGSASSMSASNTNATCTLRLDFRAWQSAAWSCRRRSRRSHTSEISCSIMGLGADHKTNQFHFPGSEYTV